MHVLLDIRDRYLKGAFLDQGQLCDLFVLPIELGKLEEVLSDKPIDGSLLLSVDQDVERKIRGLFSFLSIPFATLTDQQTKVTLDVENSDKVKPWQIANIYGALSHFPQNDCIVIDLGNVIHFDFIGCNGSFLGGTVYTLSEGFQRAWKRPDTPIGKTTNEMSESGLYWGLLGAIERITSEMRQDAKTPSEVKVIVTGASLDLFDSQDLTQDLGDFVDLIDPSLTLIGTHEILKEQKKEN